MTHAGPPRVLLTRHELAFDMGPYPDVKDPAVVRLGRTWHLYGTGCNAHGRGGPLQILHATAPALAGPWRLRAPAALDRDLGPEAAAPGVIVAGRTVHLFVQTSWSRLGGTIEHFVSTDGGTRFEWADRALESVPHTGEAGIYDPDPCVIDGVPYLVYSGMSTVGRPDVYLARSQSGTWDGPWRRLSCILSQTAVDCHNQPGDPDYEWGLEGGQLVQLSDGTVLLNAVCFLRGAPPRTKQRVLFALADDVEGPYDVLGVPVEPRGGPHSGENGHATALVDRGRLHLLFQERVAPDWHWRFGWASAPLAAGLRRLKLAG